MSASRREVLEAGAPGTAASAPAEPFAVGVREFAWSRGDRSLVTRVFYPSQGSLDSALTPGALTPDAPTPDAPIADGAFPVIAWSHGRGGNPESYGTHVLPLVRAGFIVPAPVFPTTATGTEGKVEDVYNGSQSRDVSEVLTRTLALNEGGDMFAGHMDTANGVGAAGHSLGGMTTHGLLTAWPDARITAAIAHAAVDMGAPAAEVAAKVLFVHGDRDPICDYRLARRAYAALPAPKAFMTHTGQGHDEFIWNGPTYPQTVQTSLDWMRWSLYGDTAARNRLPVDATGGGIVWESELG